MSALDLASPAPIPRSYRTLATLTFVLRELRGGLRGFYVFLACISLGVMAIAGVGSVARSLTDGLAREGRVILGGDVAFSLIHRELQGNERAFLASRGGVSSAAMMRAMARTSDGRTALVDVKAVDDAYPLYGRVELDPTSDLASLLRPSGEVFGAVADPVLLARLDLGVGSRILLGSATIELRGALKSEPDKLIGGLGFAPRLLISEDALRATGLLQPGSLVRWHYRLRLPETADSDRAVQAVIAAAQAQFPQAGWEIRSRDNASPELSRNIERFAQFLTLVGLTSLLVGGVGIANAVKSYLERKRDVIATFKALGASGARVFALYLTQIGILALAGSLVGLTIGGALPYLIDATLGSTIPIPLAPAIHWGELALALVYGLLTALAFALWPLGRCHDVPVAALFRDEVAPERRWPRFRYVAAAAVSITVVAALAIAFAVDHRIAAQFVAAAEAVFVALRLVAAMVMGLARIARPRSTLLRLVIANLHRPGALTPSVVLSLGLGLALLVTLTLIDGNLRRQFTAALPERAPSFYFVDIQHADAERFETFVRTQAPRAMLEQVPMLRGRIIRVHGVPVEDVRPGANAAWVLQSDRGITYSDAIPEGSRIVAGQWWRPDYQGPPLVSFEDRIADGLGLKVGDTIVVNVLGRNVTAEVSNLRRVDWQSLGINFVMVFSPHAFAGAPHVDLATLTYPDGSSEQEEIALLKAVAQEFPTVTTVRVKEVLETISKAVVNLTLGMRGASAVTLIAAVLVLGGALATGHRHRVYDAVVLKTLGATRGRLLAAYALEYLLLGLATALFGVAAGSAAAAVVVGEVMDMPFAWLPIPAVAAAAAAVGVTVVFGLIGTFAALSQKPAAVLRHL